MTLSVSLCRFCLLVLLKYKLVHRLEVSDHYYFKSQKQYLQDGNHQSPFYSHFPKAGSTIRREETCCVDGTRPRQSEISSFSSLS